MRKEVMPDILPSLFRFEIEIHSILVKKIPGKFKKLTRDLEDLFIKI